MTKERLRQYDSLIQELAEEQERLVREERHARLMEQLCGVGNLLGNDRLEESRARVRALAGQREDEIDEIRLWVDCIPDALIRRTMKLRYLDGLDWGDIARRMGYADESGPRKLCDRYMESAG